MSRARGALEARSISKAFGDTVVLDRVSLAVTPGSRIGVVGPNGIGKSTLLRVLAGLEQPDSGTLSLEPPGLAVAYLAQVPDLADRSGGEAARAELEAILASDVDVLLLDEPTNDLDFAGLELLDRFLDRHRGGLVAVSHDRAFLERMTRIVEFEAETRRVREYPGGWSAFEAERSRSTERQQGDYRRYVDERDRIREQARTMRQWEERGYGQGRKKKKSKDVGKRFEKKLGLLERVEKPWSAWRLELDLTPVRRAGDVVARLEQAVVEREGFRLGPLDLEIRNGDRLVVRGRNGAGKSTLLQALLGEVPLEGGRRWIGPGVVLGDLPQGQGQFVGEERTARSLPRCVRTRCRYRSFAARQVRARRRRRATALLALSPPASGAAPPWRCWPRVESTPSCSTSRPTTSTSRRSSNSSRRSRTTRAP